MKLLFDENLAQRLTQLLAGAYPGSAHVRDLDLGGAIDREIWDRAAQDGSVLVTRDEDFHRLSVMLGPPAKVIRLRLGNSSTAVVADLLKQELDRVPRFCADPEEAFLALR